MFKRKKAYNLGIDCGPRFLRGICLSVDKSEPVEVLAWGEVERGDSLSADFRRLLEEMDVDPGQVQAFLGISDEDMLVKNDLLIPSDRGRKDVETAINLQFPETENEQSVRYFLSEKGEVAHGYLAVSVIKRKVLEVSQQAAGAGLKVSAVDLRLNGLWRAADFLYRPEGEMLVVILEGGQGAMVVAGEERPRFMREVFAESPRPEIERTMRYLAGQYRMGKEELLIPEEGEGDERFFEEVENRYLVAYGMAIYELAGPRLNFIPGEVAKSGGGAVAGRWPAAPLKEFFRGGGAARVFMVAVPLLCLLLLSTLYYFAWSYQRQLAEVEKDKEALAEEEARYREVSGELEDLQHRLDTVNNLSLVSRAQPLDDIRYVTPAGVRLISITSDEMEEAGASRVIVLGEAADVSSVGFFRDNLEALPWYRQVEVVYSYRLEQADGDGGQTGAGVETMQYEFEINAVLEGEGDPEDDE